MQIASSVLKIIFDLLLLLCRLLTYCVFTVCLLTPVVVRDFTTDLTIFSVEADIKYMLCSDRPQRRTALVGRGLDKGQRLQVVDTFTYLGSTLSRVVHIDGEVNARIAKASTVFGQLRGSVLDRSGIRLDTKLKV